MRIDPVYGTAKMHKGLDFTAPQGTPIYATGNGRVEMPGFDESGYGNHVIINNGYGYKTLFGDMAKIKVKTGEHVSRWRSDRLGGQHRKKYRAALPL